MSSRKRRGARTEGTGIAPKKATIRVTPCSIPYKHSPMLPKFKTIDKILYVKEDTKNNYAAPSKIKAVRKTVATVPIKKILMKMPDRGSSAITKPDRSKHGKIPVKNVVMKIPEQRVTSTITKPDKSKNGKKASSLELENTKGNKAQTVHSRTDKSKHDKNFTHITPEAAIFDLSKSSLPTDIEEKFNISATLFGLLPTSSNASPLNVLSDVSSLSEIAETSSVNSSTSLLLQKSPVQKVFIKNKEDGIENTTPQSIIETIEQMSTQAEAASKVVNSLVATTLSDDIPSLHIRRFQSSKETEVEKMIKNSISTKSKTGSKSTSDVDVVNVKVAMQPESTVTSSELGTYLRMLSDEDSTDFLDCVSSPTDSRGSNDEEDGFNVKKELLSPLEIPENSDQVKVNDVCKNILSPNVPMSTSIASMFARKRNTSSSSESPELMRVRIAESLLLLSELNKSKFCVSCKKPVQGDCILHGNPMHLMKKTKSVMSLPQTLTIQKSSLPKAGLGVFSLNISEIGSLFGPMEGEELSCEDNEKRTNNSFVWEIYKEDRLSIAHYLDCVNQEKSNWLRFINCARFEEEQNLIAEQHDKKIFFKAYKKILPGDELLVWYGNAYGSVLQDLLTSESDGSKKGSTDEAKNKEKEKVIGDKKTEDVDDEEDEAHQDTSIDHFRCAGCKSVFSSEYYLDRHRTYVCPESSEFHCDKCSKIFKNIANYKRHKRRGCELEKSFKCIICSAAFTQKANLKVHLKTHLNIRDFKCHYCDRYFSRNTFLKNHIMSVHEKEKPFVCSECGKTFSRMDSMKRHAALHKDRESRCDYCGMMYHTLNNLSMHIKRNHTDNTEMLEDKCRVCLNTYADIKSHMFFLHQKKAVEKCNVCKKSYRNLTNHMKSHEREESGKQVCPICGKQFVSLNGHMKKHIHDAKLFQSGQISVSIEGLKVDNLVNAEISNLEKSEKSTIRTEDLVETSENADRSSENVTSSGDIPIGAFETVDDEVPTMVKSDTESKIIPMAKTGNGNVSAIAKGEEQIIAMIKKTSET